MFKAVNYTPAHFDSLMALIEEQAEHHGEIFAGDPARLRAEFGKAAAHTKAFFIEHEGENKPVGLAVIHELHTPQGRGLYLEDLYISKKFRETVRGTGSFAFGQLIRIAREENYDYVNWMVAADNEPHTFNFYLKKCQAQKEDLSMLSLSKKYNFAATPPQVSFNTSIHQVAEGNYKLSLKDKSGQTVAGAFMNLNFSTFRTVTGLRIEPHLPAHSGGAAAQSANDNMDTVYESLYRRTLEFARDRGYTGHVVWAVPQGQSGLENFLKQKGLNTYCLDEKNPATQLLPYKIGRDDIDSDLMERLQSLPRPDQDDNRALKHG